MIVIYVLAGIGALSILTAFFGFVGFLLASNEQPTAKNQSTFDYNLTGLDVKRSKDTENDYRRMFQPFGKEEK